MNRESTRLLWALCLAWLASCSAALPETGSVPPPPPAATPTGIDSLKASASSVVMSDTLTLVVNAHASNPGEALTYTWSATAGTLSTALGASTSWTAPGFPGGQILTVTVIDARGHSVSSSLDIDVSAIQWTPTASMTERRLRHTSTLLSNGQVLVAGGDERLAGAELYNPVSGSWRATGSMTTIRVWHTATLLPNGKVLVTGGHNAGGYLATAELYDPVSGRWSATLPMATQRASHTATLLPNGKVLVTGGYNNQGYNGRGPGPLATAEVYDPDSGTWSNTSDMSAPRSWHTATSLPNGQVLVAGGASRADGANLPPSQGYDPALLTAQVYDPASGAWRTVGSMAMARAWHTATPLLDGRVLVTGGCDKGSCPVPAELYDPARGTWSSTGASGPERYEHAATRLPDGRVLVTGGGEDASVVLATAQVYDPATDRWSPAGAMGSTRSTHTATLLQTGQVLITGGFYGNGDGSPMSTAEVFTP